MLHILFCHFVLSYPFCPILLLPSQSSVCVASTSPTCQEVLGHARRSQDNPGGPTCSCVWPHLSTIVLSPHTMQLCMSTSKTQYVKISKTQYVDTTIVHFHVATYGLSPSNGLTRKSSSRVIWAYKRDRADWKQKSRRKTSRSNVMGHMSRVTCHLSTVTYLAYFLIYVSKDCIYVKASKGKCRERSLKIIAQERTIHRHIQGHPDL